MHKSIIRKPGSFLLSLLMMLSVFGGMGFTVGAEDAELHNVILRGNADRYADSVTVSVSPTEAREGELVTLTIQKKTDCVKEIYIPYCYFSTDVNSQAYEHSYNEFESYERDSETGEFAGTFRMPAQDIYVMYFIGNVDAEHEYGAWEYAHQGATDDGDLYTGTRTCAVCSASDPETRNIILRGNADRYAEDVSVSISADEATAGDLVTVRIQKTGACATQIRIPYCYITANGNIGSVQDLYYSDYESYAFDPDTNEFTGTFSMSAQTMYVLYYIGEVDYTHTPGETVYDNYAPYSSSDPKTACDVTTYCAVCGEKLSTERTDAYRIVLAGSGGSGYHAKVYQDASCEKERDKLYFAGVGERVYFSINDRYPCSELKAVTVSLLNWGVGSSYYGTQEEPVYLKYHGDNIYSFVMPNYPVKLYVQTDFVGHTWRELRRENEVPATCTESGSYGVYRECIYCGIQIDDPAHVEVPALGHTEGKAAVENLVLPTREAEGGYDLVVRCAVCGDEMSRAHTTLEKLAPSDTPDQPSDGENSAGLCKYCGKDHSGSFVQRIIGFFHSILYFFSHLFGKM